MDSLWWRLPGPAGFIAQISQDLIDGRNVVVLAPDHLPEGLGNAVEKAHALPGGFWCVLCLTDTQEAFDPVEWIYANVGLSSAGSEIHNAETLAAHEDFAGMALWIEGMTCELWACWAPFLSAYQRACRNLPHDNRPLLCVVLEGELALQEPVADVCLSVLCWDDVVSSPDLALYASIMCPDRYQRGIQRDLAIATASCLALWDPEVVERLLRELHSALSDPRPILAEIAHEREWDCMLDKGQQRQLWAHGMLQRVGGKAHLHSAALLVIQDDTELRRRMWRAQLREILPYIEEERWTYLKEYDHALIVPWTDRDTGYMIEHKADLELSHIRKQFRERSVRGQRIDEQIWQRIGHLCDARNELAHLRPLDGNRFADTSWLL